MKISRFIIIIVIIKDEPYSDLVKKITIRKEKVIENLFSRCKTFV